MKVYPLSAAMQQSARTLFIGQLSAAAPTSNQPGRSFQISLVAPAPTRLGCPRVNSHRQPTPTRRGRPLGSDADVVVARGRAARSLCAPGLHPCPEYVRPVPMPLWSEPRSAARPRQSRAHRRAARDPGEPHLCPRRDEERRAVWSQPDRPAPADAAAAERSRQHRVGRAKRPLGQPPRRSAHPRK